MHVVFMYLRPRIFRVASVIAGGVFFAALLCCAFSPVVHAAGTGKVTVYPGNHHYLQDANGKPFLLIGYSNEELSGASILDKLKGKVTYTRSYAAVFIRSHKFNINKNWEHQPWTVVGGKVDMDTWNDSYWLGFRSKMNAAQDRNIVVGLTIWDGHTTLPTGKFGSESFWNSGKNVQGIQWAYDLNALNQYPNPSKNGGSEERVVYYQRRFVDKVLAEISGFSNVIIELNNEDSKGASEGWWLWWAKYFSDKGYVVAVNKASAGEAISDSTFKSSPYIDMKSYHLRTDTTLTSFRYAFNKVIVSDGDNSCTDLVSNFGRRIAWKSVLRGGGWNDFVCMQTPFPNTTKADYYGILLDFFSSKNIPFWDMAPKGNLSSSAYALVKTGNHYLVYTEKDVKVDLSGASGILQYEWYYPRSGSTVKSGTVSGGAKHNFSIPGSNDYILWITTGTGS